MKRLRVGVVGLGYWGPNYVRNFFAHPKVELIWACDLVDKNVNKLKAFYPQLKFTKKIEDLLNDQDLDCIAIATPPQAHYNLTKAALLANKHTFVAKPLTKTSKETAELINLAKAKKKLLYGDLTYLFSGAVVKIKELMSKDVIGKPLYYDSTRTNLGIIQGNVNVIWDLVPHDLSIIDYCLGLKPERVLAISSKHINPKTEELAHVIVNYSGNFVAHIHVSWISPVKTRTITIGGTKRMIYFDDIQVIEKIKIYNKGIIMPEDISTSNPTYRSGDILIPKIDDTEALFMEIDHFIKETAREKISYANAKQNYQIIKVMEACNRSLREGVPVNV